MLTFNAPYSPSESAAKLLADFNASLDRIHTEQAKHQSVIDEVNDAHPEDVTPADIERRKKARIALLKSLQAELPLLRDMRDKWPAVLTDEHKRALADADKNAQATQATVTAKLTAMGFLIVPPDDTDGLFIPADRFAKFHPDVRKATGDYESARTFTPQGHDFDGQIAGVNAAAQKLIDRL